MRQLTPYLIVRLFSRKPFPLFFRRNNVPKLFAWSIFAVLFFAPPAAYSTTVNINVTLDLDTLAINTGSGYQYINAILSSPITTISIGDQVHLTYDFLGNQRLRMSESTSSPSDFITAWLNVISGTSIFTITNITVDLLDYSGSPLTLPLTSASQNSGSAHIGPSFSNVLGPSSFFEFSGISAVYTVSALSSSSLSYRPWFLVQAQTLEVIHPVPEPATLLLLGFGLVGLAIWGRRKTD